MNKTALARRISVRVPTSLRQLIDLQLELLPSATQAPLEAASVAGKEFAVAAVAATLDWPIDKVEAQCAALERRGQFVQGCGTDTWPDGTIATRCGFRHDLYREILYERVPAGRRARQHQQIGLRLEAGYGAQASELAALLAEYFVRGHDAVRAVWYLQDAGGQAEQRNAHQKALAYFVHALELLPLLPDTSERIQQEIRLRTALGLALMTAKGSGNPEVEHNYTQAIALCQHLPETLLLYPVVRGLWQSCNGSAKHRQARKWGVQLLGLARRSRDTLHRLEAHHTLWATLYYQGALTAALRHARRGLRLYEAQDIPLAMRYGTDHPGVCGQRYSALILWLLGYPDQAKQWMQGAVALARDLVLRTANKGSKTDGVVRYAVISTPLLWGGVLSTPFQCSVCGQWCGLAASTAAGSSAHAGAG